MSKTIQILCLIFVLALISPVMSQNTTTVTSNTSGNASNVNTTTVGQNADVDPGTTVGNQTVISSREYRGVNATLLRERLREKKQEMEQELERMNGARREVYQNQNRVREAVHALIQLRSELGEESGIGRNISEIATEFNNSVQRTLRAEEKIKQRSRIMRFLFGGDKGSSEEIRQQIEMNTERIQRLKEIRDSMTDEEIRELLQEHIQNMEQEQNRLRELTESEGLRKGLLGWLFK